MSNSCFSEGHKVENSHDSSHPSEKTTRKGRLIFSRGQLRLNGVESPDNFVLKEF